MEKMLSKAQCQKILQNRFKTQEIKFIDYELKPISEIAEGYMGEHYNLTITYDLDGKVSKDILFMKKKPTSPKQAEMANEYIVFEKEILVYDVLLSKFEANGYDTSFAAKSYYFIPGEAIIMENLVTMGFKLLERNEMFDVPKIQCVLNSLALYHGAGLAYEKTKSKELGRTYRLTDDFGDILEERFFENVHVSNNLMKRFWSGCYKTVSNLIKILPRDEEYRKEFLSRFFDYKFGKIFADETKFIKTCGHGDLWSNNMMFKFSENTPIKCCLVDFQLMRYFYPAFDLILSIYGNTDAAFRKEHLQELYDYYYDTLGDVVKNYGYTINDFMTKEDFLTTLHIVKPECLLQVAFIDTVIYSPKEDLPNSQKDDGDLFEAYVFNNSDIAVKLFKENELFAEVISEILYDINDALIAKEEDTNTYNLVN